MKSFGLNGKALLSLLNRLVLVKRWDRYADQLERWERHPAHWQSAFESRLAYYPSGVVRL